MPSFYHKLIPVDSPLHQRLTNFVRQTLGRYRQKLHAALPAQGPLRVIIGAGGVVFPGWINLEFPMFDATNEQHWREVFGDRPVDHVLAEHVLEHLTYDQTAAAARQIFRHLRPGGSFRIAVPDGFHTSPQYIEYVRPGGSGAGAHDHKILWTHLSLGECLRSVGFAVEALEYYTEAGEYRSTPFTDERGVIRRSKTRGFVHPILENHSSLIVDAVKAASI